MASAAIDIPAELIRKHLRASRWREAMALYEQSLSAGEKGDPEVRLGYAIALICGGRIGTGIKLLTPDIVASSQARIELRRYVVPRLIGARMLDNAAEVLGLIVAAHPDSVEDHRLLGSVYGRLRKTDEAIAHARRVVELQPDDLVAQAGYLQALIQARQIEEAGEHASKLGEQILAHPRLTAIGLMALTRSGRSDVAATIAISMDDEQIRDEQAAAALVRTLAEAGRTTEAIETGERLLERGWDDPTLRSYLAQAYMTSKQADRYAKVAEHVEAGLCMAPADGLMNHMLGEALLRQRRYSDALGPLAKAVEVQPKVPQARALYARALKQVGRHADAAREFRALLKLDPSAGRWQRYAAGALSQAGQHEEAASLFDAFVSQRAAKLPDTFEDGLQLLHEQVDEVHIPQPRLDWAWSLRAGEEPVDRAEWDRAAKWGHLADHYLLDWLECRGDRVHEAMMRLANLDGAERALSGVDRSHGLILASAHIGAMFAGPLALELLGVRARWLASTPSVARTNYARSLISTSDQDEMQVAKSFMQSLRQGYAVVAAVDGAINLGAPRIPFEGQEITYSNFAARTAHRLRVPSMFCAPFWRDGRIDFVLERLPDAQEGEDEEVFGDRWREAFLQSLRGFLGGAPENLRLSGGIWRHIR
jgi:tetratricopeptide (TPR) repeat protein